MGKVSDLRVRTLSMPSDIHLWAEISRKEEKLHESRKYNGSKHTASLCSLLY